MRIAARAAAVRHQLFLAILFVRDERRRGRPLRRRAVLHVAAEALHRWAVEAEPWDTREALVLYEAALAARRAGEAAA